METFSLELEIITNNYSRQQLTTHLPGWQTIASYELELLTEIELVEKIKVVYDARVKY